MSCSGTFPTLKNSNVIPGIAVFIHLFCRSCMKRPPYRIKIQINATKFGLKIILLYWPTIANFVCAITFNIFQNTTKRKKPFSLKRTTFVYVLSSDWWISGLTPIILYVVKTSFPWKTYHYANVKEYVPTSFLTLLASLWHCRYLCFTSLWICFFYSCPSTNCVWKPA